MVSILVSIVTNNSGSFKGMKQLKLWKYLSDDLHVNFKIFRGSMPQEPISLVRIYMYGN